MYKMIDKDLLLKMVQEKGPIIPNHLKKDLGGDTIIIGAILSQLVAEGKAKVTHTKIGGSPAYYTIGSEEKLQDMIKHLNEKDRRTAEFLREKKVLQESVQDPLVRVSLHNIKDFSKPLEVHVKGQKEIFWKWYLLPTAEAEKLIMKIMKPDKKELVIKEEAPAVKRYMEKAAEPSVRTAVSDISEKKEPEKPKKIDVPDQLEKKQISEEPKTDILEKNEESEKEESKKEEAAGEIQRPLVKTDALQEKDSFFATARDYLTKNGISIMDYTIIRKSEVDMIISVPTKIGSQEYFCKAKNKKKINDGDLSSAYVQGQQTKLPILFLSPGELSKRAKEMLAKSFKGMTVKNM